MRLKPTTFNSSYEATSHKRRKERRAIFRVRFTVVYLSIIPLIHSHHTKVYPGNPIPLPELTLGAVQARQGSSYVSEIAIHPPRLRDEWCKIKTTAATKKRCEKRKRWCKRPRWGDGSVGGEGRTRGLKAGTYAGVYRQRGEASTTRDCRSEPQEGVRGSRQHVQARSPSGTA